MAGSAFKKGIRLCIFCERPGASKEHILPQWLSRALPPLVTETHKFESSWIVENTTGIDNLSVSKKVQQGHLGTRKTKAVCKKCNNEWLSRLEEKAKPVLFPTALGERLTLDREKQTLLATWIMKTTITNEYAQGEPTVSLEDRRYLKENLKPPDNWTIIIAHYEGAFWNKRIYRYAAPLYLWSDDSEPSEPVDRPPNTQSSTFGIGRMLAHSVSSANPAINLHPVSLNGTGGLFQIWPIRSDTIDWPTAPPRTDEGAWTLAEMLYTRLVQMGVKIPSLARPNM